MAKQSDIQCSVLTPEKQVLEAAATAVVIPAHDGLIGILKNRAPLICELGKGELRIDTVDGKQERIQIDGGFASVRDNEVTILTEKASQD